jgi:hypothetical protein
MAADKGKFDEAKVILTGAKNKVLSSPSAQTEISKQLLVDMNATEEGLSNQAVYDRGGKAELMGNMEMHSKQRSNKSAQLYQNVKKKAMIKESNAYTASKSNN